MAVQAEGCSDHSVGYLLDNWHTGKPATGGEAFTASARLFRTRIIESKGPSPFEQIFLDEFDRVQSASKTIESYPDPSQNYGWLLGADGDNLVFNKDAGMRMFWVSPPPQ